MMKQESKPYREFRAAVHGWAFAHDDGLKNRIAVATPLLEKIEDQTEKRAASYTLQAMRESL